ncbi:MAG TPA: Pycsar system effector family protein [Dehalococcoidia bacterium]
MLDTRTKPDAPHVHEVATQWQRIEHHTRTLDRSIRMTQMSDAKVAPVLALHVSLAAVTVTQASGLGQILRGQGHSPAATAAAWILLALYGAASLLAAFNVIVVYVPTAPRRGIARTHTHSLFYFDDIQALSAAEFEALSVELDLDLAERDVIHQAHTVSRIATEKMQGVQRAYLFSALTLMAWIPLILLQNN